MSKFKEMSSLKKGLIAIGASLAGLLLIFGIFLFFGFNGNPFMTLKTQRAAQEYVDAQFPGNDFDVEGGYDFKMGGYFASVSSPSSIDTHFTLYYKDGQLAFSSYEDQVSSGYNTYLRISEDYNDRVRAALQNLDYTADIVFGELNSEERADYPFNMPVLDHSTLKLDGQYNVAELGKDYGRLVVYVDSSELSAEKALKVLRSIKTIMDDAGLPFRAIDFTLQKRAADESVESLNILGLAYADIAAEDALIRIEKAIAATEAYYAQQDYERDVVEPVSADKNEDSVTEAVASDEGTR